jgi:mevalonate kinase
MIRVTCPGKLILCGEHAAVYGRPALVAAAGMPLVARMGPGRGPGVALEVPQLGIAEAVPWSAIADYSRAARAAWDDFAAAPSPDTFARVRGEDPAHLVKVALGETLEELGREEPPPLHLFLRSELPLGSGFGSSAAAAVAIVAGLLAWLGEAAPPERLLRLALEAERRQHGSPSGIDTTTIVHGGVLALRRSGGDLDVERVEAPAEGLLSRFQAYGSGTPAESTGAVVAAVGAWGAAHPERFARVLDALEAATLRLRGQVALATEDPADVLDAIRSAERGLEELGVVPAATRERVRAVEAAGGAAKISGAGASTGSGGGTLLVYHPDPERLERIPELAALPRYRAALGAPGARVEITHEETP